MPLKNYADKAFRFATITGWTQVGATDEYYKAASYHNKPLVVYENASLMSEGIIGSLSPGEWGWGSPASPALPYNTMVVCCTASADPATQTMKASLAVDVLTVAAGYAAGIMSLEIQSEEPTDAKNVKLIRTDSSNVAFFENTISIPALDTVIIDHAICLEAGEKLKWMSQSENIGLVANANTTVV